MLASERGPHGQEHLLSASMEYLLKVLIHLYQKMACGPRVVLSTLSGERHALGSVLAAFLALGASYSLLLLRA